MISRFGNKGFFAAHYEWIALAVGLVALAVGAAVYVLALGDVPEEAAAASVAEVKGMQPSETGVVAVDMTGCELAARLTRSPLTMAEVSEKSESFLSSERRVLCRNEKCKKPIPGDIKVCPACPFCGTKQEEERKVVLDADGDGMPDEWERKFGLNSASATDASADADGDGFTNLEEFLAKTDPTNKNDHPDYLDSLAIVLPLKPTYMPFVFTEARPIRDGWRCGFFDASQKDSYGRLGRELTAVIGQEIGKSGFVLKAYEKKEERRAIKGAAGLTRMVDVSEVTVERKSDGKVKKLVRAAQKREKPAPIDVQAHLRYTRGSVQDFQVVVGDELELSGLKYRVSEITPLEKGAKVTVDAVLTGKKRTLEALEQ